MLLWWPKRSFDASSGVMKPKPFSSLSHFTVPVGICPPVSLRRRNGRQANTNRRAGRAAGRTARNTGPVRDERSKRLALAAASALALADASIVTLALPRLLTELDASVEGVAAVIGVYTVVMALALLPAEALRRRVGAPRLGVASLGLFAVACAGCAAAGSLELLLLL